MQNVLSAFDASALAATVVNWLVESGLGGSDVPELLAGLCHRLNAGGVVIDRAGCAILTLHPQIVSQEVAWHSHEDRATTTYFTPKLMEDPNNRRGPYFDLALKGLRYKRFLLSESGVVEDMPLLARLRNEGYAEYFGFFHATGGAAAISPFARRIGLGPCVVGSFATRRPGGFGEAEINCFKSISETLALAAKSRTNYDTASRLLDIYVGRSCGSQVLDGRITRGDSERISCGIWLCDLRQSSRLVTQLPLDDYITLLNRYFDVTVGAVMGASGEVLKFIGDAVMGIFVMYGNVGTDERMDFTVIGRAVNEAARLQGLTKQLGHPVLASASFVGPIRDRFDFVGAYTVAGFDEKLETYTPRA